MDTPIAQQIFNGILGFGAFCGVFILKMIFDRIKDAKDSGVLAVVGLKDHIEDRHKEASQTAIEAKLLAIRSLDQLNNHKLYVAENYPSLKRLEQLEAALFKKLDAIEGKLDRKQDK